MDSDYFTIEIDSDEYRRIQHRLKFTYETDDIKEYSETLAAIDSLDIYKIVGIITSSYKKRKSETRSITKEKEQVEDKLRKLRIRHGELETKILDLRQELSEKDSKLQEAETKIAEQAQQIHDLCCIAIGITPSEAIELKREYESGASLRQIAKRMNCDKSTAKRRLMKIGVTIRE